MQNFSTSCIALYFALASVILCMMGCTTYRDEYPEPDKRVFHEGPVIGYRNLQTGELVSLKVNPYDCAILGFTSFHSGSHEVTRVHTTRCGQIIRRNDQSFCMLDHSIMSEAGYDTRILKCYFENDHFEVVPLPADSVAVYDTVHYEGQELTDVFVFTPVGNEAAHAIQSVYYHPDLGLIQLKDVNGETWQLVR